LSKQGNSGDLANRHVAAALSQKLFEIFLILM